MVVSVNQLLLDALSELNVIAGGEVPQQYVVDRALTAFNELLDQWNVRRGLIFYDQFPTFPFTAGLNPHTIGPAGATWIFGTTRPVDIDGIAPISGTTKFLPMRKRSATWWQALPVPTLQSSPPTDFYYDPTEPNGSIFFYPVPSAPITAQLWTRGVLAQVTQFLDVDLSPGYRRAFRMSLAEMLAGPLRKPWTQKQENLTREARAVIADANAQSVPIGTRDAGMPRSGNGLPNFFWPDGSLTTTQR